MNLQDIRAQYLTGASTKAEYIRQMHQIHAHLFEYASWLPNTDVAAIEISDERVVMTFRSSGVKMLCDDQDHRVAPLETLNFGTYEGSEASMALRLIQPGQSVFDIGANAGWYALHIARLRRDVQVYAFEPIPHTYSSLRANIELNALENVHSFPFGFAEAARVIDFYFYPEGSVNASAANLTDNPHVQIIPCQVERLDDFVAQRGMAVDFIKCDVEGAELFVFQGSMAVITRHKPVIFTEMLRKWSAKFNYHPNDIIELLGQAGYRCFIVAHATLQEVTAVDEDTIATNFYFLHSEHHATAITSLARPM